MLSDVEIRIDTSTNVCTNSTRPLDCEAAIAGGKSLSSPILAHARGMLRSTMDKASTDITSSSSAIPPDLASSSSSDATTNDTVTDKSLPILPNCDPAEISMDKELTRATPLPEPTHATTLLPSPIERMDETARFGSGPPFYSAYDPGTGATPRLARPTLFFQYTDLSKVVLRKLRREIVALPNPLWQVEMKRMPIVIDGTGCAGFVIGFNIRDVVAAGPKSMQRSVISKFLCEQADPLAVPFQYCQGEDKPGLYLACRGQQRHPSFSANGQGQWPDMTVYGPTVMILAMCTLLILDSNATAHVSLNLLPMLRTAHMVLSSWEYETDVGRAVSDAYRATELRCLERVIASVEWAQTEALDLTPMETLVAMINAGNQALIPPLLLNAATHKKVVRWFARGQQQTAITGRAACNLAEASDTQSTLAVEDHGEEDTRGGKRSFDEVVSSVACALF